VHLIRSYTHEFAENPEHGRTRRVALARDERSAGETVAEAERRD
jgi:hypothetical protein